MFKYFLKKFYVVKNFAGKYIPTPIKKEYKTMKNGMDDLTDKFFKNYYQARTRAKLQGRTKFGALNEGLVNAIAQTKITKKEIPPLCALAGACSFLPYPGITEAGYAIGKILTSKPASKIYTTSKKAVVNTYSAVNNILKI